VEDVEHVGRLQAFVAQRGVDVGVPGEQVRVELRHSRQWTLGPDAVQKGVVVGHRLGSEQVVVGNHEKDSVRFK
jgi:hypothetical protein